VKDLFDNLKKAAGIERGNSYGVSKPRILVCAPSNAAIGMIRMTSTRHVIIIN
jgi:hypothetical protein